jgi:hypothetical protein
MNKWIFVVAVFFCISCAPGVRMQNKPAYYPEQNALLNSEDEFSDSLTDQTDNDLGPYLKGYHDGMMMARNVPLGGCMVGGCLIGAAGVAAGAFAPFILSSNPLKSTQFVFLFGSIPVTLGSVSMANKLINVMVPNPMTEDSLYQQGFKIGYRVCIKSRRQHESLKGTGIGVGTACLGLAVLMIYIVIVLTHAD